MSLDAVVSLRAVPPFEVELLLQNVYSMENPMVAMMSTAGLGIASVTNMAPARQVMLAQGLTHIREFEGVLRNGFPVRDMELVMQGASAVVEINIMVNLFRWAEFMGPCLQVVAGIELAGATPTPAPASSPKEASVRAVVDKNRPEQVEYQLVQSGVAAAIATLPTEVKGQPVVNIKQLVVTQSISGADVVFGDHRGTAINVEGNMSGQFVEGNNNRLINADHGSSVTMDDHSVHTGNVSGTGVAIGAGAKAQVTMAPENRDEILKLLQQLHDEIQAAPLGDGAKNALSRSIPEMQQAVQSNEPQQPQDGIKNGLNRINDQLEAAGAVAGNVSGIVQTLAKIAEVAGVGIKIVAPFVASLLV
jgi:hypothetical protein